MSRFQSEVEIPISFGPCHTRQQLDDGSSERRGSRPPAPSPKRRQKFARITFDGTVQEDITNGHDDEDNHAECCNVTNTILQQSAENRFICNSNTSTRQPTRRSSSSGRGRLGDKSTESLPPIPKRRSSRQQHQQQQKQKPQQNVLLSSSAIERSDTIEQALQIIRCPTTNSKSNPKRISRFLSSVNNHSEDAIPSKPRRSFDHEACHNNNTSSTSFLTLGDYEEDATSAKSAIIVEVGNPNDGVEEQGQSKMIRNKVKQEDDISEITSPSTFDNSLANLGCDSFDKNVDEEENEEENGNDESVIRDSIAQMGREAATTSATNSVSSYVSILSNSRIPFDDEPDNDCDEKEELDSSTVKGMEEAELIVNEHSGGKSEEEKAKVSQPQQELSSFPSSTVTLPNPPSSCAALANMGQTFRNGVNVGSHTYHFKRYDNTFVGKDAVTYMVDQGLATSREDAVFVGQRLMKDLQLFHHVCWDHNFKDGYYFYRFAITDPDNNDAQNVKLRGDGVSSIALPIVSLSTSKRTKSFTTTKTSAATDSLGQEDLEHDEGISSYSMLSTQESGHLSSASTSMSICTQNFMYRDMNEIARQFQEFVTTGTHMYHFKKYKDTFVGREAVDYMVKSKMANSREDAVFLGQRLLTDMNLFRHVCNDHNFKDSYLFYRYTSDPSNHNRDQKNGSGKKELALDDHPLRSSLSSSKMASKILRMTAKSGRKRHNVEFDTIHERVYECILEVHPSTSSGPSVGLGWRFREQPPQSVNEFELVRICRDDSFFGTRRRRCPILSSKSRKDLLKDLGYTKRQLTQATRLNEKIRKQRKSTLNNFTARRMPIEDDDDDISFTKNGRRHHRLPSTRSRSRNPDNKASNSRRFFRSQ